MAHARQLPADLSVQESADLDALRALFRPHPGRVTPATEGIETEGIEIGLGPRRVRCEGSVADAVIEDRR